MEDGREAPGRKAYVRLVAEIEADFLSAVQKNMLMRTFWDPVKNARMLAVEYSSTERLGELLERYFYQPFKYGPGKFAMFDLGNRETRNHIFPADSAKIVRALTRIRTAMDAFTDREADTLMYYGYQLSRRVLESNGFEPIRDAQSTTGNWRFLEIGERFLTNNEQRKRLIFHLLFQ